MSLFVEYRGDDSIVMNCSLPKVGSIGMVAEEKGIFYKVKFPYRCFDELVKKEELIVTLVKSQFVDTDLFLLDKLNEWAEKETEKMFDKLMDFMQKHGNDKEKIEDIFGEELSEKMFDFYKKINKKRLTILKKCDIL